MYVDKTTVTRKNGEEYTQYLLRTSKRQGKKTIKTTLLNITHYGEQTCEAIRFASCLAPHFASRLVHRYALVEFLIKNRLYHILLLTDDWFGASGILDWNAESGV